MPSSYFGSKSKLKEYNKIYKKFLNYEFPYDSRFLQRKHSNVVGIIPITGYDSTNLKFPWHASMMPIGQHCLAIEKAIKECAFAGCRSIWIVGDKTITPLLRHRIGESVYDPVYSPNRMKNARIKNPIEQTKLVPIFYIPTSITKDKTDLVTAIFHGIQSSFKVSMNYSLCILPSKFYIAFPFGIYNPKEALKIRKNLKMRTGNEFFKSPNGLTALDNEYLGFGIDIITVAQLVKKLQDEKYAIKTIDSQLEEELKDLVEEPNRMTFSKLFDGTWDRNEYHTVDYYYNIITWEQYCNFLSSKYNNEIKFHPNYKESYPVGMDVEEEEYTFSNQQAVEEDDELDYLEEQISKIDQEDFIFGEVFTKFQIEKT